MDDRLSTRGVALLGCGRMGSALLAGWLDRGLSAETVWVTEPAPSDWLANSGVHLNAGMPDRPALVLVAIKPQMLGDALPGLASRGGGDTIFLSVAAGVPIRAYEAVLGANTPVVRAMPNTPAAIGRGITALVANDAAGAGALDLAETLMAAVGETVRLDDEGQMDAVTAVSGSGPAYVFHMIEALAEAGVAEGLPAPLAMRLARATVSGAGALADNDPAPAEILRRNVTSPGGTTAAGLNVLMAEDAGLTRLMRATVAAAAARSRELGQ